MKTKGTGYDTLHEANTQQGKKLDTKTLKKFDPSAKTLTSFPVPQP